MLNWLRKKKEADLELAKNGLCPNCWGHQQYDYKYFELAKKAGIDPNNLQEVEGFIQKFVREHVSAGAKLDDEHTCPTCQFVYHPSK